EHQLKSIRRRARTSALIYADMDGLKLINDTFGHNEGSLAISRAADILRGTFRESDIIGRLGGDEFAVLAPEVSAHEMDRLVHRLADNLQSYNAARQHPYELSLSIGALSVEHHAQVTIQELLAKADEIMYQDKRSKRTARQQMKPP